MYPGSLSNLELQALRSDQDRELGNGTIGKFYRYDTAPGDTTYSRTVASDGTVSTASETIIYQGRCDISTVVARRDRYETRLGEHIYLRQYRVSIPVDESAVIQESDRFEVISSHSDPQLVGRVMTVKDVHHDSELSKRRITLIDDEE